MRVAAIGDAHLGRSYYSVTTEAGVNQREVDFEQSFGAAVDLALSLEPELVVWLGDIFDYPSPSYRSYRVAQRALAKIREHGVRVIVISGNHDTPRLPGTGSPYSALADAFPEVGMAHRLRYERFELPGLVVHAVPQMLSVEAALEALDQAAAAASLDRVNLLLTHPRLVQLQPKHDDINELEVDAGRIRSDLALLGHYHSFTAVGKTMWYAGATDTFSFADEPERPKGVVLLDTDTGECRHLPLQGARPLVTLEPVYALGLDPGELQRVVLERASSVPPGAVARLYLEGVDPESYRLLDMYAVREAAREALVLKIEPQFAAAAVQAELPSMTTLGGQWDAYLEGQDLTGFDRERVKTVGHRYIEAAVESAG